MDFRFESQERHNGQPPQLPNEVWSHVPSRRSNFRLLHRLLTQIARVVEINALTQVTREVVETARESLVIGTI
jgi:hypothetical protein